MATVGNWQGYTELVELLLEKSADVERRDRGGATALVWACAAAGEAAGDVGPATALVAAGASVNSRGWDMGDTPLLCAVSGGHTELAQLLIGAGAELGVADEAGRGVVDVAVEGSLPDLANALIEAGAPCDLGCACALGDVALVERLLDDASGRGVGGAGGAGGVGGVGGAVAMDTPDTARGMTPLMKAAAEGHALCVKLLLERGASLTPRDDDGRDALLWACESCTHSLTGGEREEGVGGEGRECFVACAKVLVGAGAAVETSDAHGHTPLIRAAVSGHAALVTWLIEIGAPVDARDAHAASALLRAAAAAHDAAVAALIAGKADLDAADRLGRTALHAACERGHEGCASLLIAAGAPLNCTDLHGETALMAACEGGGAGCVTVLLRANASPTLISFDGETALLYSVRERQHDAAAALLPALCAPHHAAGLDARDACGRSALMRAIAMDDSPMVTVLLEGRPIAITAADTAACVECCEANEASEEVRALVVAAAQQAAPAEAAPAEAPAAVEGLPAATSADAAPMIEEMPKWGAAHATVGGAATAGALEAGMGEAVVAAGDVRAYNGSAAATTNTDASAVSAIELDRLQHAVDVTEELAQYASAAANAAVAAHLVAQTAADGANAAAEDAATAAAAARAANPGAPPPPSDGARLRRWTSAGWHRVSDASSSGSISGSYFANALTGETTWDVPVALLPGWVAVVDPHSGAPYYTHMESGQTRWDVPAALLPGWKAHPDPSSGEMYYVHAPSGEVTWEVPAQPRPSQATGGAAGEPEPVNAIDEPHRNDVSGGLGSATTTTHLEVRAAAAAAAATGALAALAEAQARVEACAAAQAEAQEAAVAAAAALSAVQGKRVLPPTPDSAERYVGVGGHTLSTSAPPAPDVPSTRHSDAPSLDAPSLDSAFSSSSLLGCGRSASSITAPSLRSRGTASVGSLVSRSSSGVRLADSPLGTASVRSTSFSRLHARSDSGAASRSSEGRRASQAKRPSFPTRMGMVKRDSGDGAPKAPRRGSARGERSSVLAANAIEGQASQAPPAPPSRPSFQPRPPPAVWRVDSPTAAPPSAVGSPIDLQQREHPATAQQAMERQAGAQQARASEGSGEEVAARARAEETVKAKAEAAAKVAEARAEAETEAMAPALPIGTATRQSTEAAVTATSEQDEAASRQEVGHSPGLPRPFVPRAPPKQWASPQGGVAGAAVEPVAAADEGVEVGRPRMACDNYRVDMAGANFGDCKCGRPKIEHASPAAGGAKRIHPTDRVSAPVFSKHVESLDTAPSGACDEYRVDVAAAKFGDCKCGHPKAAHVRRRAVDERTRPVAQTAPTVAMTPAQLTPQGTPARPSPASAAPEAMASARLWAGLQWQPSLDQVGDLPPRSFLAPISIGDGDPTDRGGRRVPNSNVEGAANDAVASDASDDEADQDDGDGLGGRGEGEARAARSLRGSGQKPALRDRRSLEWMAGDAAPTHRPRHETL